MKQTIRNARVMAFNADEVKGTPFNYTELQMPGPLTLETHGWLKAGVSGDGKDFLTLGIATRLLPTRVLKRVTAERVAELEALTGKRAGAKQRREIKDAVLTELLPGALINVTEVSGHLDYTRGIVVIYTTSAAQADLFIQHLRKSSETIKLRRFEFGGLSASGVLTEMARSGRSTEDIDPLTGLIVGDEINLEDSDGATSKHRGVPATADTIKEPIASGSAVTGARLIQHDGLGDGEVMSAFIEPAAKGQLVFKAIKFHEFATLEADREQEHESAEAEHFATQLISARLFGSFWGDVVAAFDLKPEPMRTTMDELAASPSAAFSAEVSAAAREVGTLAKFHGGVA